MPLEYRGNVSEDFMRKLEEFPWLIVFFCYNEIAEPDKSIESADSLCLYKSKVVNGIMCSVCSGAYIGQTVRRLSTRLKDHWMKRSVDLFI